MVNVPRILWGVLASFIWQSPAHSFTTPSTLRSFRKSLMATQAPYDLKRDETATYTDAELELALASLWEDSDDPDTDARHIFGYGDPEHKLSKLQEITATVILDYERYRSEEGVPSIEVLNEAFEGFSAVHGRIKNLQRAIQSQAPSMALAAEFKRASPSKGNMAPNGIVAAEQGAKYANAGANIISILTEPRWFKGSLKDLSDIRLETNEMRNRPVILRKDFVVSDYMIAEAAAAGADTVLLIVAVLPKNLLKRLIDCARMYGMEPLVEVHETIELDVALEAGAKVIGVNNRNLHTFQLDLTTAERVAEVLRKRDLAFMHQEGTKTDLTLCALSGMSTAIDVDRYRKAGVGMCLIGESLMRAPDPGAVISSLCLNPKDFEKLNSSVSGGAYTGGTQIIKICGITQPEDALVACRSGANLIGVIFAERSKRKVTPQQAKMVVEAVRSFGERQTVVDWGDYRSLIEEDKLPPILHLVRSCNHLTSAAPPQRPLVVGVFQNQDVDFIRSMVEECGLDLVQLHGSEGMQAAAMEHFGVPAIRVVDVAVDPETGTTSTEAVEILLESLTSDPFAVLLDTSIRGSSEGGGGGTGLAFDWSIAEKVQSSGLPVIIAGGLTPESVRDCIGAVRPFGVDVSSGVEVSPGKKDPGQIREFVQNARSAACESNKGF